MKNMFKPRLLTLALTVIMLLTLASCGADGNSIDGTGNSNSVPTTNVLAPDAGNLNTSTEIDNKLSIIGNETLQYPGTENGYSYNAYESYAEITHCPSNISSLEIPETIDGLPVWVIGKQAAKRNETVESVTIPDTVVKISEYAFYEASNLNSVHLPNSVAIIEEAAFYGTESPELTISENIRIIGDQSFPYHYQSHSITIPESAQSIGYLTFNFDSYQKGDTITITILSKDVLLSDQFYRLFNRDNNGNIVPAKIVIRGYAGSTAASYCADHNKTMEVIPE